MTWPACASCRSNSRSAQRLAGTNVKPSTTIGFPHGGHTTAVKAAEAMQAMADGGVELDMVVNISKVLSLDWAYVREDIQAVADEAHQAGGKIKVIFENCYLEDRHKIRLCEICGELGVDWVKTSTGFGTGGTTDEDLILMRKHSPPHVQVKAAGGIRTLDRALEVRHSASRDSAAPAPLKCWTSASGACKSDAARVPARARRAESTVTHHCP